MMPEARRFGWGEKGFSSSLRSCGTYFLASNLLRREGFADVFCLFDLGLRQSSERKLADNFRSRECHVYAAAAATAAAGPPEDPWESLTLISPSGN